MAQDQLKPIGASVPALTASEGQASSPTTQVARPRKPELTEAQKDHQAWIMGRSETFLEPFFKELDDDLMDARMIEWAAVLLPLSAQDIDDAMVDYHRHGPRSKKGKLLKPAVGDIYARAAKLGAKFNDRAAAFADRYKTREVLPFEFRDDRLIAEVLDRNLLTVEELQPHGAFIPARHKPAALPKE